MSTVNSSPGSWFSYGGGTVNWDGGSNGAQSNNGVFLHTIAQQAGTGRTNWVLRLRGFDFSSLPSTAIILGVQVDLYGYAASASVYDIIMQLVNGSAGTSADRIGSNKGRGSGSLWPTTNSLINSFGSASDLWGAGLTRSILVGTNFAIDLNVASTVNQDCYVDYASVTVTYAIEVTGLLASPDAADTFTLTAAIQLGGGLGSADVGDSVSQIGALMCAGLLVSADTVDTFVCLARVRLAGALAAADFVDIVSITAGLAISGVNAGVDAMDLALPTGMRGPVVFDDRLITWRETGAGYVTIKETGRNLVTIVETGSSSVEA